jgi:hypothetical protein
MISLRAPPAKAGCETNTAKASENPFLARAETGFLFSTTNGGNDG